MSDAVIYKITNILTGYIYVGSTTNFIRRCALHRSKLKLNKHPNKRLQLHYNLLGSKVFKYEILETITDTKLLSIKELEWSKLLNNTWYNIAEPGRCGRRHIPVMAIDPKSKEIIYKFSSIEHTKELGFDRKHIGKCCANKPRYFTHKGFIWKYC